MAIRHDRAQPALPNDREQRDIGIGGNERAERQAEGREPAIEDPAILHPLVEQAHGKSRKFAPLGSVGYRNAVGGADHQAMPRLERNSPRMGGRLEIEIGEDRKSTRLNTSNY